ncbi:hypothetical protein [Bacillus sp. B1-b2]|uniref:hypothetical protein n=1 Tax=Bacillus sp. B1-b2 TaxID=2653201 RepID=UPI00126234D2|nr:hypothetical protein [Bacillus sp. B1-b2]KAB7668708.1 hypothetical protein F9279_12820 [Bacillus sp. B1-b2]
MRELPIKKTIFIVLVAIIILGIAFYSYSRESIEKMESLVTDNNRKVIEPISGDTDHIGH